MEMLGQKIDFLGDSITEGVGVSRAENRFCDLLSSEYGILTVNHGISGTRIARQKTPSVYPDHDKDFISRVDDLDGDADVIMVFGGTNDYGHGDAPMGTMGDRTPYTFYGALHTLYTALITRFPQALIVVMTPLHRLNENALTDENGRRRAGTLRDYVNAIREVAEYYSLPVLDLYKDSGMQPQVPVIQQMYVPDGLHPNDAGHEILKNMIYGFLKNR